MTTHTTTGQNNKLCFGMVILTALCLLAACGEKPFYEENREIRGHTWSQADSLEFAVEVTDTVSGYNFFLNLRHTESYEYSNIYVFFTTHFPDGRTSRDTIACTLADENGVWIGKSSGSLVNNRIVFGVKRIFPMAGSYRFVIQQGMRDEELPEVTDVGLCIEKSKQG